MRKIKKIVAFLCTYFLTLFVIVVIAAISLPTDQDGTVTLGTGYTIALLFVPIACGFAATRIRKTSSDNAVHKTVKKQFAPNSGFMVPKSAKKQQELAESLLLNAETCFSLANESTSVSLFVDWYEDVISCFQKISQLEKAKLPYSATFNQSHVTEEYQLHLCDALVRSKEETIRDIKGKYRNSREFQEKALSKFEDDVNSVRTKFSSGTDELADKCIKEVQSVLGIRYDTAATSPPYFDSLSKIDKMDGHTFEHWCAKVLENCGYKNVEVTPGSGDQGVDVLAEKGGIKYAIQCKCYSSDLGNTPIQEVNTGKTIYHCQIGVVMTNRHFTAGAKQAAEATGVLLWDRETIEEMANRANMI